MFPTGYYFYYPYAVTLLLILFIVMQPVALLFLDPQNVWFKVPH